MGDFTSSDAEPPAAAAAPAAHPGDAPPDDFAVEDDLEVVAIEPDRASRMAALRAARPPRNPGREARSLVAVWAAAAVLVVALVAGAIAFRGEVVKLVPQSQAAYAGLGLSVNSVGLVIEGLRAEPTFLGGRPVLSITGALRNVRDAAVTSPALRINLLNRAGKPIAAKIVRPIDPRVPAGATRHFAIAFTDPPANAQNLEVLFDVTGQQTAVAPIAPPPAPAPVEAQPIPAGSPDALADHG
jgi:hypothetical protein